MALALVDGHPSSEWTDGTWTPVTRAIRRIGDAAARVSQAFREAHEEIPWGSIAPTWPSSLDGVEGDQAAESGAFLERTLATLVHLLEAIVPPQPPDDA